MSALIRLRAHRDTFDAIDAIRIAEEGDATFAAVTDEQAKP